MSGYLSLINSGFLVSPNPVNSNSIINIELLDNTDFIKQVDLFDLKGSLIFKESNQTFLNNKNVETGIYLKKVITEKGVEHTKRIVID